MQRVTIEGNFASEDEYFLFEEKSETRHELINGNLYEMSGISKYHNDIVLNLIVLFRTFLSKENYRVASESYKYCTPDKNFFYPDIMICETDSKHTMLKNLFLSPKFYRLQRAGLILLTNSFNTKKLKHYNTICASSLNRRWSSSTSKQTKVSG